MGKKSSKKKGAKIAAAVAAAVAAPPAPPVPEIVVPPDVLYVKVADNGGIAGVHHDIKQLATAHTSAKLVRYVKVAEGTVHNDTYYSEDGDEFEPDEAADLG